MQLRPVDRLAVSGEAVALAAPVGGWNTRDALAAMSPLDAIAMENLFPGTDTVTIRQGHVEHSTGNGTGAVEALKSWKGVSSNKLIATGSGGVWDATASGAATQIVAPGTYSDNYWQMTMFNGRLHAANGVDPPWNYDGATLTASGWTGPTSINSLFAPFGWKGRMYFIEANSGNLWYGDVGAHTGALVSFDVGQIAQQGGYLLAIGSWSIMEAGVGLDDRLVLIMSTGEVLIYSGESPADTLWTKIGSYKGAEPIGRNCTLALGADLIISTKSGYLPLTVLMRDGTVDSLDSHPTWGKIRAGVQRDQALYGNNRGWEPFLTPSGDAVYFNVAQSAEFATQHVLNPVKGSWTRYSNLNALAWAEMDDEVYFAAAGGIVYRMAGALDRNEPISFSAEQAYSYFGSRTRTKRFTAVRPLFTIAGTITGNIAICTDFTPKSTSGSNFTISAGSDGAEWDTAEWDTAQWASAGSTSLRWITTPALGRAASLRVQGAATTGQLEWHATDFLGQFGGLR